MNLPRITIVTASAVTNLNRIGRAMGEGSVYFSGRKLCAIDPNATHLTPATHWLSQDMSAQAEDAPVWQSMAQQADLPPIVGTWGEDGVISSQDAQAALTYGNLKVYTAAGEDSPAQWCEGILTGLGLQLVPDEPM